MWGLRANPALDAARGEVERALITDARNQFRRDVRVWSGVIRAARLWGITFSARLRTDAALNRLRIDRPLRARACARAREIIEEFSLGSIASPVRPTVSRAPLSYRSCRRRGWSGWWAVSGRSMINKRPGKSPGLFVSGCGYLTAHNRTHRPNNRTSKNKMIVDIA